MAVNVSNPPIKKQSVQTRRPDSPSKLIYVANKLGLDGIADMQGSSVNIFDTVAIATNPGRQVLTFFSQAVGKSRNFSNFQRGTLQAGEAMVIEELAFLLVVGSAADLTADTTAITTAIPVTQASATQYPNKQSFCLGLGNVVIANSKVVKDFNCYEMNPAFNGNGQGIAAYDTATATNIIVGPSKIKLESPPVLPPNQALTITLEIPPTGTIPANSFIMCIAGRFGSIFSGKTTY